MILAERFKFKILQFMLKFKSDLSLKRVFKESADVMLQTDYCD